MKIEQTAFTLDFRFWEEEMERQTPWLMSQKEFRTDESVRVGKSKLSSMLSCSIM